ncbi:MAG TPA: LLM class flavin-dependent oxidoreductase [Myxococcota bacterium]
MARMAITIPAPFHDARANVELAKRAEGEWGYPAIWMAETAGPDSFSLAGAMAVSTSTIEIGTAIVPVYNRTPAVLAMSAATLAQLSNDRFVLGLGASSHAIMGDWNGVDFRAPLGHVRESVAVIRQALGADKTDFEGKHFRSHGLRLGAKPKKPLRIYLAALREQMCELAGEIGEGLIINFQPASAMPQILAAYRRGAARAGRDGTNDEVVCRFQLCVTHDRAKARAIVRAGFGGYLAAPVYNAFLAWCGFEQEAKTIAEAFARRDRAAVATAITDEIVDRIAIIGTPDECREQIAGFVAAGVTTPVLAPLATSPAEAVRMLEALAPARA